MAHGYAVPGAVAGVAVEGPKAAPWKNGFEEVNEALILYGVIWTFFRHGTVPHGPDQGCFSAG